MAIDYTDKIVWLTGASSGIGEALTYTLHDRGARLIISSRRREVLEKVKANCNDTDRDVRILPLDLAKSGELPAKAEEALSQFGRVDMLINNGGISQRSYAVDTKMDVLRNVMEVNFFGTVGLTKAILPSMIKRQDGHIVVVSSVMGKIGTRLRSSYAASKHALHGWFDCLRQEVYDKNIDVTLVCPGFVKTNVTINALEGDGSRHGEMGRGQREGMEPDEFAGKMLSRIDRSTEEIYIGGKEIAAVYLKRFAPKTLNKLLRNTEVT